jgi:hypothetical protein
MHGKVVEFTALKVVMAPSGLVTYTTTENEMVTIDPHHAILIEKHVDAPILDKEQGSDQKEIKDNG